MRKKAVANYLQISCKFSRNYEIISHVHSCDLPMDTPESKHENIHPRSFWQPPFGYTWLKTLTHSSTFSFLRPPHWRWCGTDLRNHHGDHVIGPRRGYVGRGGVSKGREDQEEGHAPPAEEFVMDVSISKIDILGSMGALRSWETILRAYWYWRRETSADFQRSSCPLQDRISCRKNSLHSLSRESYCSKSQNEKLVGCEVDSM